jgi:hypothetical protein
MDRKKRLIQTHHINYDPEWTVKVYKGEHMILTRLQWRKVFSKGFFVALKEFIKQNEDKAVALEGQ